MIERPNYLNELIRLKDNGFPKVITGIRRCGKSFLLKEIYKKYLLSNGIKENSILIIELDDIRNSFLRNPYELHKYVLKYCKNKSKVYVFIDEIQLVNFVKNIAFTNGEIIICKSTDETAVGFVDVILGLSREKNIDLYVTGSNSKMLSKDVQTSFRDKASIINLYPLSFEEFSSYKNEEFSKMINEYLLYGGLPLSVLNENKKKYLKDLYATTYFKDIVERNRLNKSIILNSLSNIISDCIGFPLNSVRIANSYLSKTGHKICKDTIDRLLGLFKDLMLISECKRYDVKGLNEIGALRKFYFIDLGLRNAQLDFAYEDRSSLFENFIYNELIYNGFNVSTGVYEKVSKDKNNKSFKVVYEIDFYAKRGLENYYIQVCDNLKNEGTYEREIKAFLSLKDQIKKILVVNENIDEYLDKNGFTIIGVEKFINKYLK